MDHAYECDGKHVRDDFIYGAVQDESGVGLSVAADLPIRGKSEILIARKKAESPGGQPPGRVPNSVGRHPTSNLEVRDVASEWGQTNYWEWAKCVGGT